MQNAECRMQSDFSRKNNISEFRIPLTIPWQKIFGRDNLIVRVFEPEKFKNGLLGDFL